MQQTPTWRDAQIAARPRKRCLLLECLRFTEPRKLYHWTSASAWNDWVLQAALGYVPTLEQLNPEGVRPPPSRLAAGMTSAYVNMRVSKLIWTLHALYHNADMAHATGNAVKARAYEARAAQMTTDIGLSAN